MERDLYCAYRGTNYKEDQRSGVKLAVRGPRMTIATTTEYGVDEDSEYSSRVTRSVIDNYMKRPSLADRAIGTIATMAVDASGETAAIAGPCTEEAFLSQFVGKAGPFEGIEVVAGATFTSNAVIEAVNSLFPTQDMSTGTEETPVAEEPVIPEASEAEEKPEETING